MANNHLIFPISILAGCIILGGFYYASETNKQKSIERQQQVELQAKAEANKAQQAADQTKADQAAADDEFSNNLKCQSLLRDLKIRWNNVVGIYYSALQNTCIVKYTQYGTTMESPIGDMQDTK